MGTIPVVPTFPAGQLATGASMQLLATAATWCLSGKPQCQLTQTTAQSIPNSTQTALAWNNKVTDRDSGWSSSHNTRYTAQTPGYYLLAASVAYAANGTGQRQIVFRITTGSNNPGGSGNTTLFGVTASPAPATYGGGATSKSLTPYLYDLDYVEVLTQQNSGGALSTSLVTAIAPSQFTIVLASG